MLPVVRGDRETARQVLLYTVLLVALTLVPVLTGTFGPIYLAAAVLLGARFLQLALSLWRSVSPARAGALFHYSLAYLALLFAAAAIEPVLL
jgi:protoheme IX farnesyltransferase